MEGSCPRRKEAELMYEKILVAIDQSPVAEQVLTAARELAQLSSGEVRVLHLREREIMGVRAGAVSYEGTDEARATADRAVRALAQEGIKASGEARSTQFGHAAREIVGEARDFGAEIIVMGSRGHSDLAGLVLGSTAHKVIHLADRPVLVVR
jgi:nucleotide-binding universal stress UspA family protein